jgi:gluconolactonase
MRRTLLSKLLLMSLLGTSGALYLGKCRSMEAAETSTIGEIQRLDPALDDLIPAGTKIEVIGRGMAWCEGPAWIRDGNFLLCSDIPNNAIMRWDARDGLRVYLKPAGYTGSDPRSGESGSNGLVVDRHGHLVLCQHGDRRIARLDSDWKNPRAEYKTLADRFEGKRFNSPNDAIVDSRGAIYFTDPPYGLEKGMDDPQKELDFQGVFRIDANGKLALLTKELERPNGIALSPDEKTLYVSNSHDERPVIMAYPLQENGELGASREFFNAKKENASGPGACDGLTVDENGNLFATIPGGVAIFTPGGKQLGLIATGDRTANCEFGEDGGTLFICGNHDLLRVKTATKGIGF